MQDALKIIQDRDPSGWEREPTDADYARHEAWAVATYGRKVWDTYARGGWGEEWRRDA